MVRGYDIIDESDDGFVHERIEDPTLKLLISPTKDNNYNSYTYCTQKQ